jgi:hypothetical protein
MSGNYQTRCPKCGGFLADAGKTFSEMISDHNSRGALMMVAMLPLLAASGALLIFADEAGAHQDSVVVLALVVLVGAFVTGNIIWFSTPKGWRRLQCLDCKARFRYDRVITVHG